MNTPLMPKATAVWLVENTTLTFEQISNFCGMHPLEVQGVADGDVASGIIGQDPVVKGLITKESIENAESDPSVNLVLIEDFEKFITVEKKRKNSYTPIARRQDKPDAIAWIVKNYPDMSDLKISKLIGTTKNTIAAIRNKTHWNSSNLKPRDPVLLGLCTQTLLHATIDKMEADKIKEAEKLAKAKESKKKKSARKKAG